MSIEDTSVYQDVLNLSTGNEPVTQRIFECTLTDNTYQIDVVCVNALSIDRDYKYNYSDCTVIEVMMPEGTYAKSIYPRRRGLYALVKAIEVTKTGIPINDYKPIVVQRFRATIIDAISPALLNAKEEGEDFNKGDIGSLISLSIQLTDEVSEYIRQVNMQAILRNVNLFNTVKTLLIPSVLKRKTNAMAMGVLMTPPDNTKVYKQIILNPSLSAIDLVDWLQDNYGIYNNGLGVYLQKKYWYVFPLMQTVQFKESDKTITIISMSADRMRGTEKTFVFKNNHLLILATANIEQKDNTDSFQRNIGNGMRYINADRVIDRYSQTSNGTTTLSKKNNVIEYKAFSREDGYNYVPFSSDISSVNNSNTLSTLSYSQDNIVKITWENSNPTLLLPGMQVRYLYRENKKIKKLTGTLLGVRQYYSAVEKGILQSIQSSVSLLTIVLNSV